MRRPEFEQKILADPLMVGEMAVQRSLLAELSSYRELEPTFVEELSQRYRGRSNIR